MITDTHVYFDRWPFRRLPDDDPHRLADRLAKNQIDQAWVASFDALLHRDVADVNNRLADACQKLDPARFLPFGAVHPLLPDWQEDLRRCAEVHHMRGVRLFPAYHGYALDHPHLDELWRLALLHRLVVQIVLNLEDPRTQHPLVTTQPVQLPPLLHRVTAAPAPPVVLLGLRDRQPADVLDRLAATDRVWFDFSMIDGVAGLRRFIDHVGLGRVLFGSLAPLFYVESNVAKLRESELAAVERRAVGKENAANVIAHFERNESN